MAEHQDLSGLYKVTANTGVEYYVFAENVMDAARRLTAHLSESGNGSYWCDVQAVVWLCPTDHIIGLPSQKKVSS